MASSSLYSCCSKGTLHYIVMSVPTYLLLSQKQMEINPRAHQQEMFFLAPFLDGAYSEY